MGRSESLILGVNWLSPLEVGIDCFHGFGARLLRGSPVYDILFSKIVPFDGYISKCFY